MSKLQVCASSRCFFPKAAFFYSTAKMAKLAHEVGYQGIEFLPTWRFVWEMKRYGRLLAPKKMIASGHRDWRFDRLMEAELQSKPWWQYQFREIPDLLFPPSSWCLAALRQFQKKYQVPISVMWFKDAKNFTPVMLELWDKIQGLNYQGLIGWLKRDPGNRGVVIDTAKFTSWLASNRLLDKREKVLEQLLPHVFEVHYRSKKKGKERGIAIGAGLSGDSGETLRLLLAMGYHGRVVVEFGWPDLDKPPFGWVRENLSCFRRNHRKVIAWLKENRPVA